MLMGEFQHNVDKKGRVFIPAKLRDDLGECFVLSRALDGSPCLFGYSLTEWDRLNEKLRETPFVKARGLQRFFFSSAEQMETDSQGRVCIPQNLREYAGLSEGQAAVIVGASNRIELWNRDAWKKELEKITPDTIVDLLTELNF